MYNFNRFTNVVSEDMLTKIKKDQKAREVYRIATWRPQTFDKYPEVTATYFEKDWISNVISQQELSNLDSNTALTIIAQTGSGKTSFIFNKLVPMVINQKSNKKILYLCSRISLANQMKQHTMKNEITGEIKTNDCTVKDFKKYFSEIYLQNRIDFGLIHIMTYQSYLLKSDTLFANDYDFVIFDEFHYFLSDSTFNPFTERELYTLIKQFRSTRRIYLTATAHFALDIIYEAECNNNFRFNNSRMHIYYSEEDYSYATASFFNKEETIAEEIIRRKDENWLIFVISKQKGMELETILNQNGVSCKLITADTDKTDEKYLHLLKEEKLPVKCLITTRLLDVGINIKTPFLNIVLFEQELTELKQMLGRKRKNGNEPVKVYFYVPNIKELSSRLNGIKKRLADIKSRLYALQNNEFIENLESPFYCVGAKICYNSFCLEKLQLEIRYYDNLLIYLKKFDDSLEQNTAYANLLLKNFENITFDENNLFLADPILKINNLFKKYENKTLSKEEFDFFSGEILNILGDPRVRNRDNNPSISTWNKTLEPYNYFIKTEGNPTKYTLIKAGDNNV